MILKTFSSIFIAALLCSTPLLASPKKKMTPSEAKEKCLSEYPGLTGKQLKKCIREKRK